MTDAIKRRSRRRAAAAATALAATTATLTLAGASAASAAAGPTTVRPAYSSYVDSYNYSGVNLRACGATTCTSYAYMPNYTGVTMLCWEDTQWVYPPSSNYASPRWFRVSSPYGTGYVHSSLVFNQTSVGAC